MCFYERNEGFNLFPFFLSFLLSTRVKLFYNLTGMVFTYIDQTSLIRGGISQILAPVVPVLVRSFILNAYEYV